MRDCHWYPDFLQAYPEKDVKICLYKVPDQACYRVLVEIHEPSKAERPSLDQILLNHLKNISVEEPIEVRPEEWPFD